MLGTYNAINQRNNVNLILVSPVDGEVIPLSKVDDPYFSTGKMGRGIAVIPSNGKIYAPADSIVAAVFKTGHAVILKTYSGIDLLIHIGIDTVRLNGEGFKIYCQKGDNVQTGDLLVEVDLDLLNEKGYCSTIPIIVCNADNYGSITMKNSGYVKALTEILDLRACEPQEI